MALNFFAINPGIGKNNLFMATLKYLIVT